MSDSSFPVCHRGQWRSAGVPAALDTARLKVDARSLAELIAMAPDFARLLAFAETDGSCSDGWSAFFEAELPFLLAQIATCDPWRTEAGGRIELSAGDPAVLERHAAQLNGRVGEWRERARRIVETGGPARAQTLDDWLCSLLDAKPGTAGNGDCGTLCGAIAALGVRAASLLEQELADEAGSNSPHSALYLAFLEVQQILQKDLNHFAERHLAYYYDTVLRLRPRTARPDTAYVMFELVPSVPSMELPAGTLLSAGKDRSGNDVLYATCEALPIDQTVIQDVMSVFVPSQPPVEGRGSWVQGVHVARHVCTKDGAGGGWPTFGAPCRVPPPGDNFGLLLGSTALLLTAGERQVQVRFALDPASMKELQATLEAMLSDTHSEPRWTTAQALRLGLRVALSGAAGWFPVPAFSFQLTAADTGEPALVLEFTLAPGAPACVPNHSLLDGDPATPPLLKFDLDPAAPVCLYSLLEHLHVARVELEVRVAGLPGIELLGAAGPLAAGTPFPPFGTLPQCGMGFTVRHPELGAKRIEQVELHVEWDDFLQGADSLASHYRGYGDLTFDDAQFQVCFKAGSGPQWERMDSAGTLPLFAGGYARSTFKAVLPEAAACDGVRVVLAAPAYAFAQRQYPVIFATRALENAAAMLRPQAQDGIAPATMIAAPVCPLVTGVTLDYVARDSAAQRYRLNPFGFSGQAGDGLLGGADAEGRLYIGLYSQQPPKTLSLHFELDEAAADGCYVSEPPGAGARSNGAGRRHEISWSYLDNNKWTDFAPGAVSSELADFTRSGVVKLRFPDEINSRNTLMPAGRYWIAVRVRHGAQSVCRTIRITPHAVAATRCVGNEGMAGAIGLASGSITGLASRMPPIARVMQPFPSRGGMAAESVDELRTRISRRLRHRKRASTPADFEQLVLELYPEVWQAKCCNANNSAGYHRQPRLATGELVIAVVGAVACGGPMPLPPAPLPQYLQKDIAERLRAHSSPFMGRLTVRNPIFEPVQVRVGVRLVPGQDEGTAMRDIQCVLDAAIAPWLFEPDRAIDIGAHSVAGWRLYEALGRLPSVAAVLGLDMVQHVPGADSVFIGEDGEALPGTPWSVLVPAVQHQVQVDRT